MEDGCDWRKKSWRSCFALEIVRSTSISNEESSCSRFVYLTITSQSWRKHGEGRGRRGERGSVYRGKQVGFNDCKFPFPSLLMLSQLVSSSGELRFLAWWLMETEKESSCAVFGYTRDRRRNVRYLISG